MFLKKSSEEIVRNAMTSIAENTPFTNFSAGSIARSIVEAIAPEIGSQSNEERISLYDIAQQVLDQSFLSRATQEHLNLIGGLLSYPRRTEVIRDEDGILKEELIDDEMYRYEISQVVPSMATGNYFALRLALLTIPGVEDAIGKEYSHGTGSFSFILIPQYGFSEEEISIQMEEAMNRVKSFGVKANIILPEMVSVDITIKVFFQETVNDIQKGYIREEIAGKLADYIGQHEMGKGIIYNDMVQEIMNMNEHIVDFEFLKFYMNHEPVLLMNQEVLEDERITPQQIQVI